MHHCVEQALGQIDRRKLLVVERDELDAEILKLVHFTLALRFAGGFDGH
jgi:hypothetical protein